MDTKIRKTSNNGSLIGAAAAAKAAAVATADSNSQHSNSSGASSLSGSGSRHSLDATATGAAAATGAADVAGAAASSSINSSSVGDLTSKLIVFNADEKQFSYETHQRPHVTVVGSAGTHTSGSSKVKLKSIVDYKWDLRHYPGRLITVHVDGKHLAYAILVRSNEGMVRVVSPCNGHRALIKGMQTEVLDLQFAHIQSQMILAAIEECALHLHRVDSQPDKIVCTPLLRIEDKPLPAPAAPAALHRINWCPYVPEERDADTVVDEFTSQQLVWVRGTQFRCYSVRQVLDQYGCGADLQADRIDGQLSNRRVLPQTPITGASFSPDGSTLCVSGEDGVIRFYQVYFQAGEPTPRCLHQWTPHDGRAISSFFFLDNLTKTTSKDKSLWRHAITACADNTEIKVWCCSEWRCLQTVRFEAAPSVGPAAQSPLRLHAQIDRTSSYLVLSDSGHRALYVLQVQCEAGGSPPRNHAEALLAKRSPPGADETSSSAAAGDADTTTTSTATTANTNTSSAGTANSSGSISSGSGSQLSQQRASVAYIKSISEFPMQSPILSYHIVDAAVRRYKCSFNDSYLLEELDDYDEDTQSLYCVVLNMYLVQPKSVQECHVLYQPTVDEEADVRSSLELLAATADTEAEEADSSQVSETTVASRSNGSALQTTVVPVPVPVPVSLLEAATKLRSPANAAAAASAVSAASATTTTPTTINLMTPDSFASPRVGGATSHDRSATPEGVSSDVRSALQMLAGQSGSAGQQQKQQQHRNMSVGTDALSFMNLVAKGAAVAAAAAAASDATTVTAAKAIDVGLLEQQQLAAVAAAAAAAAAASSSPADAAAAASSRKSSDANNQILAPECGASLLATAVRAASGASSPSREVQQIMSPKNSDIINEFYDDSTTDLSDDNDADLESGGGGDGAAVVGGAGDETDAADKQLDDQYNFNSQSNSKEPHDTKASLGKAAWPKMPAHPPAALSNLHCAQFNSSGGGVAAADANVVDAGSAAAAAAAIGGLTGDAAAAATAAGAGATLVVAAADPQQLTAIAELGNKMDQMLEFMQAQQCQIAELRNAHAAERQRSEAAHAQQLQQLEKRLQRVHEEQAARAKREHRERSEEFKKAHLLQCTEFRNHIVQAVAGQVSAHTDALLLAELQQRIVPTIAQRLDQLKHQMQQDIAHKLSVSDQLLRENIARVCNSKQTMEVFGNAVLMGVQTGLQKTYADSMRGTLIPAYEKASGEMFKQVQEVFMNGTKAYAKLFENYFSQYEPVQHDMNRAVAALPAQLKAAGDQAMAAYGQRLQADLQRDLKAMQAQLLQTVRDNVRNEVKRGFDTHSASIEESVAAVVSVVQRSAAQTPAPTAAAAVPTIFELQEQIRGLLAQQQVNAAFHQALVANDLQLVEYTIERADMATVFNPCPLQQTVLLSLIQQISADMSNHNDLKQRYMAEAILNLNMRDPTTKEHAPKVLRELFEHCQQYTAQQPGSAYNSGLRMLMMAVQGLGIKLF